MILLYFSIREKRVKPVAGAADLLAKASRSIQLEKLEFEIEIRVLNI